MTEVKTRKKEKQITDQTPPQTSQERVSVDPEVLMQKLKELRDHVNSNYHT